MPRITGRVEVIVNGTSLLNKSGAVASGIGPNGIIPVERAPVIGENQVAGYTETVVPAQVEVTITDRDDIPLDPLLRINGDGTVIFRAAGGGKSYTLNAAVSSGVASITSGEGDTTLMFYGSSWSESVQGAAA